MASDASTPQPHAKQRGFEKTARIPVKIQPDNRPVQRKPAWIRAQAPGNPTVQKLKRRLREHGLHTVCEEAACPNLGECFTKGTATFMIMGDVCTRRCPFCDVAHGRPEPLDPNEPAQLAETVRAMGLRYVVITSVDRDDLRDGGAAHFTACVAAVREAVADLQVEILVPDFRGRMERAIDCLAPQLPDVFNHNLETVPRLYRQARPGADYQGSLDLLKQTKARYPGLTTKSGLMLGLGETEAEVIEVMRDLRHHDCDMLTLGQYLQPSQGHLPVARYVHPDEFERLREIGAELGFANVASGPLVRSSYHADMQSERILGESVGAKSPAGAG